MTQEIPLKELIHRAGSERALISICLNKPDQLILANTNGLVPDMFAVDGHKFIYMAMTYLVAEGKELDPISIMNVYTSDKAKEAIEELGGLEYLEAMKGSPVAPNTVMFVNHIIQASARRAIRLEALKLADKAIKDERPLDEYLQDIEARFRDISIEYQVAQDVEKLGDGIGERLKARLLNPMSVIGLRTGWKAFDLASLGLIDGELTIVGARSKVGKSTVLLNWCKKIAIEDGLDVLYIDTEMYKEEQEDKLLSMLSGVPHDEIRNGMFGQDTVNGYAKDKIKKVQDASKLLKDGRLHHVYMPNFTLEKVTALARKYQIEHNIRLVVFDYIKLPSSNANLGDKEYQALGYLTSGLKDMAGLLQIPVISAVQLNRGAVGKEDITEADIAGSDRILFLANRVCMLRRSTEEEYAYTGASHQFEILAQRMGNDLGWTPVKSNGKDWNMTME